MQESYLTYLNGPDIAGLNMSDAEILAAALLRHFKLTAADLRMHRDWMRKYCPHRLLEENRFEEFRARVAARLARKPDGEEKKLLRGLSKA